MSLELTDVVLTYPDGDGARITAVDGVSAAVPRGRLVGLTGPSGCGKSSVLSVAGTLIAPDSGRVEVDGIDVTDLTEEERAAVRRTRVGFVFQHDNLLPSLTALEQVLLPVHIAGGRPASARSHARELLAEVGLADAMDRRPHQLSGGMRQRVNIARALIGDPAVLLADEPTSALDSHRAAETMALLTRLVRERDVAALLVTHDPRALAGADDVLSMLDGRVVDRSRGAVVRAG
ncbi:ABC transporter ATP-binding protein [Gordonia phthalatica]|uniref:ABC transporter ATP-binding protein n=1 Tax=Gordonia phthalatica TaxID=1136941 RepID=A0A0N9NET4_9ACTN|nr:ABC transporter ATP-binding protein [Gordonia phthalatica]ALG84107.1 ABC transporter ATP-binding protein [Gordonia phthalatica]